jgi:hypothetical protein
MLVNLPIYTLIHVVLSLVGIFAGLVVVGGRFGRWVGLFLSEDPDPRHPRAEPTSPRVRGHPGARSRTVRRARSGCLQRLPQYAPGT